MDGTVEAHNISFSCGHLAINIALPHGEYDWSHLKYRAFEQRSGEKKKERKKYGGRGVTTFLSSLIKSPFSSSILPVQSDTSLSCF